MSERLREPNLPQTPAGEEDTHVGPDGFLPQVARTGGEVKKPTAEPIPAGPEFSPRDGDPDEKDGARLPQIPDQAAVAPPDLQDWEDTTLHHRVDEAEMMIHTQRSLLGMTGIFGHSLAGLVFIFIAGLLGFYLFNQVVLAIASIQAMPRVPQMISWGVFALLSILVGYGIIRFATMYIKLRRNRQLQLRGLDELQERIQIRWLVNTKTNQARTQLVQYLNEYPVRNVKDRQALEKLGFAAPDFQKMVSSRDDLLNPDRWSDPKQWFGSFQGDFQTTLDRIADQRIAYWARRAWVVSAASPNALVDTAAIMYFNFAMASDLCRIYHLRAGRLETMVLLSRVFFNSYLAGQLQGMEDMAADQITQLVQPHLPVTEVLLGKVFGKIGAKAGTATVNYLLIHRLGKHMKNLLRPLA
ncbi:MAG: YcjF family protein [Zavarzinella sp.]